MLFVYKSLDKNGAEQNGSIDAPNMDLAISSLQRRGLVIVSVTPEDTGKKVLSLPIPFMKKVKLKEIVMLSRQISTMFEAKVSVMSAFRLLASESENPVLRSKLTQITDDIRGGLPISGSMSKHPDIFSPFYVSMVRAGEESGKLSETFSYLADYLDRQYALTTRAQNALIYPAFVIASFFIVMIVMMVYVIPKLSVIIKEAGQDLPFYTKFIVGASEILASYGLFILLIVAALGIYLFRYFQSSKGKEDLSHLKLAIPYVGALYTKLYLSRISDNLNTMITSGISMVRALEITAEVVGNDVYKNILTESAEAIKSGAAVSEVFSHYPAMPGIMVQMVKVGEETGKLGFVLQKLSVFYEREVNNEVDTLVGLIEPFMIVVLGVAVGILMISVLVPIYNLASAF